MTNCDARAERLKRWLGGGLLTLCLFLSGGSAFSQSNLPGPNDEGDSALQAFKSEVAEIRERMSAHPPAALVGKIAILRELDVAAIKGSFTVSAAAKGPARPQQVAEANALAEAIRTENQQALRRLIPSNGWFLISRDGKEAAQNAFMLLQHSDIELQKEELPVLEQLAEQGEVRGSDYALLYDRVQLYLHLPQRYGSQLVCKDHTYQTYDLEGPEQVDQRRRDIGFTQTLKEYTAYAGGGKEC